MFAAIRPGRRANGYARIRPNTATTAAAARSSASPSAHHCRANPRTPAKLADTFRDLGWTVELGAPTNKGIQLDVVVAEI